MAEADERKGKVAAASPALSAGNPTPAAAASKSPRSREEGELSSGEEAELHPCSTVPFASTMLTEPVHISSQSSLARSFKSGNSLSMANRQLRTSKMNNYSKNFKVKQFPFKSSNSRTFSWQKKGADDNLVISFSDDDSGSDSGNSKAEKTEEGKDNAVRMDKYKMPMTQLQLQSEVPRLATNQLMSKKGSVSHASSLCIAKNSNANFRHPVASSAAKDSRIQMHITATRTSASQAHGHVRDMNLADHSLESLRHEIAIRENELKVQKKSVVQNKEIMTGSRDDQSGQHNWKLDNQVAHNSRPASANTGELAPNERPVKRLKLNEHFNGNQISDGQLQMQISSTKFSEPSSQLMKKSSWRKDKSDWCESAKENSVSSSDQLQHESNRNVPTLSKVLLTKLVDNENMVPSCKAGLPMVRNIEMPSKQVNDNVVAGDASCSWGHSGKETLPVDICTLLNQSSCLAQVTPCIESTEGQKHVGVSGGLGASNLFSINGAHPTLGKSGLMMPLETFSNPLDKFSSLASESKLSNSEDTNNRGSDQMGILGEKSMNLQALLELEELHDKELEEAQELRRRCELEERHALKDYRKAQRALIDANERCAALYQKRELFSARLQGLLMEASSFMWPSSRQQDHGTLLLDSVKSVPKHSSDMLSGLGHRILAEGQMLEQLGYKSSIQSPDGAPLKASYHQMNGHDSGDDQCCEPDVSTSDPKENSAVNGICTLAYRPNMYTDDDEENFPSDNRSVESRLACETKMGNFEEENVSMDIQKERSIASESAQDYELLEASLRSKLVARFGVRTSSKSNTSDVECHVDKVSDSTPENETSSAFIDQQVHGKEKNNMSSSEGIERPGISSSQRCAQPTGQAHGNNISFGDDSYRNTDPEQSNLFPKQSCKICGPVFSLPSSDLHNVSRHAKLILPECCSKFATVKDKIDLLRDGDFEDTVSVPDIVGEYTIGYSLRYPVASKVGDDMCDFTLDPFWPFCMFELRGKCNDDECPWQHVRNSTQRKLKQHCYLSFPTSDNQLEHLLIAEKSNNENESPHNLFHQLLPIPMYHIGSNLVKVDSHLVQSVFARSNWQYWQRGFCASFPLPVSVRRILPPDAPSLQTGDGPIVDHDNWSRHSLYFQSQDSTMKKFIQGLPDSEQSLELALDFFCGRVYKQDRKKALALISRVIETEPNSVVLWVVYLHIYYKKESDIGKDDMFSHAVQHNEHSYELWLLYINSRVQLGERLNAYHDALNILCHSTVTYDEERKYKSACILDIFLQMIDFLCMCGNVEKAIWKIYGLLPTSSVYSGDTLISDIPSYLVVSDKCIFWICCIYLVIYRKLPETVIQQFEFAKDLSFMIQWPSAHLTNNRKESMRELVKFAADKMTSDIDENSKERDQTALRALHFFAISHIRSVAALDGLHCCADLLVKYMKLYPTCIELVIMSARMQENCTANVVLGGFEKVVSNWPKEVSGIQCIWNQYVEHAIAHGRIELAERLITRWFQWFGEVEILERRNLEGGDDGLCSSSEGGHTSLENDIFAYLNLFLYKMLRKNLAEACLAVDKALKLASPEYFKHCLREHAAFYLVIESESQKKGLSEVTLDLLRGYLGDSCFLRKSEPLSRRYYRSIRKPRIRQLIDGILGPVSLDFSLVNSVLEGCYGSSLLPERVEPKDLVNFVESLMEITPANYQLALAVYRFTAKNFGGTDFASGGIIFWASTILVNSVIQAVPVAPETIWLQAANLLQKSENWGISSRFHQHAILVYPFSAKLWESYFNLSKTSGNVDAIVEAARERGIELGQVPD